MRLRCTVLALEVGRYQQSGCIVDSKNGLQKQHSTGVCAGFGLPPAIRRITLLLSHISTNSALREFVIAHHFSSCYNDSKFFRRSYCDKVVGYCFLLLRSCATSILWNSIVHGECQTANRNARHFNTMLKLSNLKFF